MGSDWDSLNMWEFTIAKIHDDKCDSHHAMVTPFSLNHHWFTTKPKIDDVVMQGSQKWFKADPNTHGKFHGSWVSRPMVKTLVPI